MLDNCRMSKMPTHINELYRMCCRRVVPYDATAQPQKTTVIVYIYTPKITVNRLYGPAISTSTLAAAAVDCLFQREHNKKSENATEKTHAQTPKNRDFCSWQKIRGAIHNLKVAMKCEIFIHFHMKTPKTVHEKKIKLICNCLCSLQCSTPWVVFRWFDEKKDTKQASG